MVSYGWFGTGFDTAAAARFLCTLPHCAVGTSSWSQWDGRLLLKNHILCSETCLTFIGTFTFNSRTHQRLWRLQIWLLISCRPPFLAEFSPPIQLQRKSRSLVLPDFAKKMFTKLYAGLFWYKSIIRKIDWTSILLNYCKRNVLRSSQTTAAFSNGIIKHFIIVMPKSQVVTLMHCERLAGHPAGEV